MKIKTLTVENFRAFPGPVPQKFTLDGKNLLVYGENGSGKSSLFHALKTFFTLNRPNTVTETCNVFSKDDTGQKLTNHWIEVEFDDGRPPVRWVGPTRAAAWTMDTRVVPTALRRGCLDYRALLDTNYGHGDDKINLFELAIGPLLGDYPAPVGGGTATIAELWEACSAPFWKDAARTVPARRTSRVKRLVITATGIFSRGFALALDAIKPQVDTLLTELPVEEMQLDTLYFPGVTYNPDTNLFDGRVLQPNISLHGYLIAHPQHFLNEARLSALGLAVYLGGRLTCVPTGGNDLKLLVLDDVLIGIDVSNRLPLLDLLRTHFHDWQIVLLTHDKTWFDMAEFHVEGNDTWTSMKMFDGTTDGSFSVPIVVHENCSSFQVALDKASRFLDQFEYQAAANYARSAFEGALKRFCEKRAVPVVFKTDLRDLNSEMLLDAIDNWVRIDYKRIFYAAALERTRLFRRIILNPLSHADAPAVKYEVEGAIQAVRKLDEILSQKPPQDPKLVQDSETIAKKAIPTKDELQIAIANLRAQFAWKLRRFSEQYRIEVLFSLNGPSVVELWDRVQASAATLFIGGNLGIDQLIEAERGWLIEEIPPEQLDQLSQVHLIRHVDILKRWS